jgi:hypothetical protein
MNAINRPESHTIKFTLKTHIPDAKCIIFITFSPFQTEIEPRIVMTELGVGKAITTHIQLKVMVIIF